MSLSHVQKKKAHLANSNVVKQKAAGYAGGLLYFYLKYAIVSSLAGMAELVDALASGASGRKAVGVRVSLPAHLVSYKRVV